MVVELRAFAVALLFVTIPASLAEATNQVETAWIWRGGDVDMAMQAVADLGLFHHQYQHLQMVSFIATEDVAQKLLDVAGGRIEANRLMPVHLDSSVPAIEADVVADAVGNQRLGPSVIVIDTGVDSLHPDFQAGNMAANLAADRLGGLVIGTILPDVVVDEPGHGTHVAGIVAGSGQSLLGELDPNHDRYMGVYHNGRIVGFQALAESDDPDEVAVDTLAAIEGMEWALANKARYQIRVVQASWGIGGDLDPGSAVTQATMDLYLDGILTVFSAGNRGSEDDALNMFCQAPWVLCVANVDDLGRSVTSSSRGTATPLDRPYAHPDIAAPGVRITAAGSILHIDANGIIQSLAELDPTEAVIYETRSGTSMAAPHVSGVAALLLASNPDLSPDQVMDILIETATPLSCSLNECGVGMVNAREAYNLAIQTEGNRAAFEAGRQVKYAGPATGDDQYRDDAVRIGYTDTPTGSEVELPPEGPTEIPPIVFFGAGMAIGLLLLTILVVAIARRR